MSSPLPLTARKPVAGEFEMVVATGGGGGGGGSGGASGGGSGGAGNFTTRPSARSTSSGTGGSSAGAAGGSNSSAPTRIMPTLRPKEEFADSDGNTKRDKSGGPKSVEMSRISTTRKTGRISLNDDESIDISQSDIGQSAFDNWVDVRCTPPVLAAVGFVMVAISLALLFSLRANDVMVSRAAFRSRCGELGDEVTKQLNIVTTALVCIAKIMTANTPPINDYNTYLTRTGTCSPAPLVSAPSFVEYVRSNEDRVLWQNRTHTQITAAGFTPQPFNASRPNQHYAPMRWVIIPILTGFDLLTNPILAPTIEATVYAGQTLASPPSLTNTGQTIPLFSPAYTAVGTALINAYASNPPNATFIPETRFSQLIGFTFYQLPVPILFSVVSQTLPDTSVQLELFDGPTSLAIQSANGDLDVDESHTLEFGYASRTYNMICTPVKGRIDVTLMGPLVCVGAFLFQCMVVALFWTRLSWRRTALRNGRLIEAIKAKKIALEMLNEARKEAEGANHSKSAFMAYLCHELRNPLHQILALLEFELTNAPQSPAPAAVTVENTPVFPGGGADGSGGASGLPETSPAVGSVSPNGIGSLQLSPETRLTMQNIQSSSNLMTTLLNDVLDFTSIEQGRMRFATVPFDFHALLETIRRAHEPEARAKSLQLTSITAPDMPRVLVADPLRLRQVISNLLSNAIKFTHSGSVTLRTTVRVKPDRSQLSETGGQYVPILISVEDTGAGMSEEALESVFDPYEQARLSHQHNGQGLGLSLVQRLVEVMGGRIEVSSKLGVGSQFSVQLTFGVGDEKSIPPPVVSPNPYRQSNPTTAITITNTNSGSGEVSPIPGAISTPPPPAALNFPSPFAALNQSAGGSAGAGSAAVSDTLAPINTNTNTTTNNNGVVTKLIPSINIPKSGAGTASRDYGPFDLNSSATVLKPLAPGVKPENKTDSKSDAVPLAIDTGAITSTPVVAIPPASGVAPPSTSNATFHGIPEWPRVLAGAAQPVSPGVKGTNSKRKNHPIDDSKRASKPRGLSCLVVDDSDINRRILGRMLSTAHHNVHFAHNGSEAVDAVLKADARYDVIFMDVVMPVMDGLEATRHIREKDKSTPIIAVTANAMLADRQRCVDSGMNAFISKPYNAREILSAASTLTMLQIPTSVTITTTTTTTTATTTVTANAIPAPGTVSIPIATR